MTAPTSAVRVLEEARALIQRSYTPDWFGSHHRGTEWRPNATDPEACWNVTTALMAVGTEGGCFVPAMADAQRALCAALGVTNMSHVRDWRDEKPRSQAEVLALYDAAIDLARRVANPSTPNTSEARNG